jgi:hypothetical protein
MNCPTCGDPERMIGPQLAYCETCKRPRAIGEAVSLSTLAPPLVRLKDVVPESTHRQRYAVGEFARFVDGEWKSQVAEVIGGTGRSRPAGVRLRIIGGPTIDVWDYRWIEKVKRVENRWMRVE